MIFKYDIPKQRVSYGISFSSPLSIEIFKDRLSKRYGYLSAGLIILGFIIQIIGQLIL